MTRFPSEEILINPTLTITVLDHANATEPEVSVRWDCWWEGVTKHWRCPVPNQGQISAISPGTPPSGPQEGRRDVAGAAQHPQPFIWGRKSRCSAAMGNALLDKVQPRGTGEPPKLASTIDSPIIPYVEPKRLLGENFRCCCFGRVMKTMIYQASVKKSSLLLFHFWWTTPILFYLFIYSP